jgi:hypothetical protein
VGSRHEGADLACNQAAAALSDGEGEVEGYKIVGIVGVFVLVLGVFMPAPLQGIGQSISYFASQPTGGSLIFALAVLALLFTYTGNGTRLFVLSVLTVIVVGWPYIIRQAPGLNAVGHSVSGLTDSMASSVAGTVSFTSATTYPIRSALLGMGNGFPWFVMLAGGALLVIASLMAPRQN